MNQDLQTTSWDNSNVYKDFNDPLISKDIQFIEEKTAYLKTKISLFNSLVPLLETKTETELAETIPLAREAYRLGLDLSLSLYTMGTYAGSAASVNSLDYSAKNLLNRVSQLMANLNKTTKPLQLFLLRVPDAYLTNFLKDESVNEMEFVLRYAALEKDFLLSVPEEVLLEGFSVTGFHAWGKLYTEISGAMKVNVGGQQMGLADASNILFQGDAEKRKIAYQAINKGWEQNEISANAVLNSLYGWRLENYQARSGKAEVHYLDQTCKQQKITRATLNTMMDVTYENRHIGHEALKLMAKEIGVTQLGPWDILAPYPDKSGTRAIPFPEAMEIIKTAFNRFSPEMADFAQMMYDKKWIDSKPTANRKSGAYCSGFAKYREPRVFLTYEGSMKNVTTLAHELGHAYHNWVMRDLKFGQTHYPSTLAETASIFAETLVRDTILENTKTKEEKKSILWQEIESAASLLVNIPARFEFEKQYLELRKTKTVTVPEAKNLNRQAWKHWYGDTLSEYNEMFWASKAHFSMSQLSFYNYPYLFGYLFSLGIYAKKDERGESFKKLYLDILRDTGLMTAEALIQKHFQEDISKKDFWVKSLRLVEKSIQAFKEL